MRVVVFVNLSIRRGPIITSSMVVFGFFFGKITYNPVLARLKDSQLLPYTHYIQGLDSEVKSHRHFCWIGMLSLLCQRGVLQSLYGRIQARSCILSFLCVGGYT
jgi:hypothetical protein